MFKQVKLSERQKQMQDLSNRLRSFDEMKRKGIETFQKSSFEKQRTILTLSDMEGLNEDVVSYSRLGRLYVRKPMKDVKEMLKKKIKDCDSKMESIKKSTETLEKRIKNTADQIKEINKRKK